MIKIPNCIAWSIQQLTENCIRDVIPQEDEVVNHNLCDMSKLLIHSYMSRKLMILKKIADIIPQLNFYYQDEEWANKEDQKPTRELYKKNIDEFVKWLRSLDKCGEEIINVHDWNY